MLATTLVIALAGCGGDDERQYVEEVNSIKEPLLETIERATADLRQSRDPAGALSETATAARGAASDLRDVEPPGSVEEENERLAAAYSTAGALLEDAAAEIRTAGDDPEATVAALVLAGQRLSQLGERSEAIVASIADELDVDVRPPGTSPGSY